MSAPNRQTLRFLYDSLGNTDCTVKSAYSGTACPALGHVDLIDDSIYDYRKPEAMLRRNPRQVVGPMDHERCPCGTQRFVKLSC